MSTSRGIFENLPPKQTPNPFAGATPPEGAFPSPFSTSPQQNSPFKSGEEPFSGATKIPARKNPSFPFEVPEAQPGFGFEAAPSPFSIAPLDAAGTEPSPFAAAPTQQAVAAPAATPAPVAVAAPAPSAATPPPIQSTPVARPLSNSLPTFGSDSNSDSFTIRQLELRAIFGVDREMNVDEIMQRARSLPGVRHIARVRSEDINAIDNVKQVMANLGFGANVRLQAETGSLEFIRESGVLLAVQTDSGFLPGIRETLIIVARELSRSA